MRASFNLQTRRAMSARIEQLWIARFTQQRLSQADGKRAFADSLRPDEQECAGQATLSNRMAKAIRNFVMSSEILPGHICFYAAITDPFDLPTVSSHARFVTNAPRFDSTRRPPFRNRSHRLRWTASIAVLLGDWFARHWLAHESSAT